MALQQRGDRLIASALNVAEGGGVYGYTDVQRGSTTGAIDILASVTFNGTTTSATAMLQVYNATLDKWVGCYDAMQQEIEATFTATTERYQLLGNPGPSRVAHVALPIVWDLWRIRLATSGMPGDSTDWTIYAREHTLRAHAFNV